MKATDSIALTRIFLHNWHRFAHHLIDVQDGLYLAGHNGSGKSSVLDALQLVLIADQTRIRYNSSAQERSARNLDSYVRGKIGEQRYLRPGNTVAYVALEFSSAHAQFTLGVCIEAAEGQSPERAFFILSEALDPGVFVTEGRPLPRRELRQLLRSRRGARSYDQVGEYQSDMLNRLGGLNERFFDLFLRALTFQPIRDINSFVEQWLLDARPLDVDALQKVVERLGQLRITAREVQEKSSALQTIVVQQAEVRSWREQHSTYLLLAGLLRHALAESRLAGLRERRGALGQEIEQAARRQSEAEAIYQGANSALREAELRLRQSDVIRRREELAGEMARLTREADQIRMVYAQLRADLRREAGLLGELRGLAALPSLATFLTVVELLQAEAPPDAGFAELLGGIIAELDAALPSAQEQLFELRHHERELRERSEVLERELQRLRADRRPSYPPATEQLRELLSPIIGERPPLLCELLEIPNERWQNAVEAMLGQRRFTIIVPPRYFAAALAELERARAAEQLYDAGLLDLEKARSEARPAQPGSLAQQVRARAALVQPYIDSVLGDIITCASAAELRRQRRAITAEVVLYSEWTVRALPPGRYQPWFIGERAQRSQIELRQQKLLSVQQELAALAPQISVAAALDELLGRGRSLAQLHSRLDVPLDERPLRASLAELRREYDALDIRGVAALEAEAERLRQIAQHEFGQHQQAVSQHARLQAQLPALESEISAGAADLSEQALRADELRQQHAPVLAAAEELLAGRRARGELTAELRNAESTAERFASRASNELQMLIAAASAFNTRFQFAALPNDSDERRYAAELERLQATELPQYTERIAQAQREAEEELREHVLHRLREQIHQARQKLAWINQALDTLVFHGERYHFRARPSDEVQHYYALISDSQLLGSGSLFESEFYQRHKATFDEFYIRLTRIPQSDAERREQERLIDYRHYLSYDIDITHADSQVSRLSRIMGQTSGGETQTPFYLTIAASFVQLYRIGERNSRPAIRVVAFDEAFSKMDQDRIGATLDLFQQFGLQLVTATPIERCEYLVPKICTSLVLTALGDSVWIEPYRNYAARLEQFQSDAAEIP